MDMHPSCFGAYPLSYPHIAAERQCEDCPSLRECLPYTTSLARCKDATMTQPTNTDDILAERASRYGKFTGQAKISQDLKFVLQTYDYQQRMRPDQCEALEMICHKIARIINGDPHYHDSWADIAGYAKLVADRLETGKEV